MTNEELIQLLKDAGITTQNTGGLLNAEQANRFIETTVEQSEFLKTMRVETNIGTSRDLDHIGVGTRLLHTPTENEAPADDKIKGVTVGKRTLTPVEVMLPYNISLKWLEENIARQGAEDQINRAFAAQFATDLADLAINGDVADAGPDATFLTITDGFFQHIADDPNKQLYSRAGSTDWKGTVFPQLLKLLPDKYKADPKRVRYYVSYDVEEEYREQLADRATALGDAYLTEKRGSMFKGIEVKPLPHMPYGSCMLTTPLNLAVGFGREVTVWRQFQPRQRRVEYTITAKIDFNYVLTDWIVYCT